MAEKAELKNGEMYNQSIFVTEKEKKSPVKKS